MKIFITGGTGFIGSNIVKALTQEGHSVMLLTRSLRNKDFGPGVESIEGNPTKKGPWRERIKENDIIINLAGASIFCRWSEENKKQIRQSRILTTQNIVEAISGEGEKSKITLLNASAVGFYGGRGDDELTENQEAGKDFLADVCRIWESQALEAEEKGVRVVLLRFGIVLGDRGGALDRMLPAFKLGLGSALGTGRQWFPWIHVTDLIRIFQFVLDHDDIQGPVNCTAPNPVRNKDLSTALGKVLHRPVFLPAVPGFFLKGLLGEFAGIFLEGQRAVPAKLTEQGFSFEYSRLEDALEDLIKKKKSK